MKQLTVRQFFQHFPDDESCLSHIFECRFGQDYTCPKCLKEDAKWYRIKAERAYSCGNCGHHLHPTVGTLFEKSRTDLQLWFYAIYLFTSTRHGVSGKELQRQLGVTYKCAWRMGHQIRQHMGLVDDIGKDMLKGHVEIDEAYIGGAVSAGPGGKHMGPLLNKTVVLGMIERDGELTTMIVPDNKRGTLVAEIKKNVEEGSTISTDGLVAYRNLPEHGYTHGRVAHSEFQWVNGIHSTNSIENYWHILKPSIASTHIHVSPQHLDKYLGEFEYRHNTRENPHLMFPELISSYPEQES